MALRLSELNKRELDSFRNRSPNKLSRPDIGSAGFGEIERVLEAIYQQFEDLLSILEERDDIPLVYEDVLLYYIKEFNSLGTRLLSYTTEGNSRDSKPVLTEKVQAFYKYMLTGLSTENYKEMPFITLYTVLHQSLHSQETSLIAEIKDTRKEYESLKASSEELLSSLQDKAKEVSLYDYAQVFSNQSKVHSSWGSKLGDAQKWLIASTVFSLIFISFIYFIDSLFPIKTDGVNATVITIEYVTRVLIVSFQIYVITFCAKQYNIQQHLATINKHRENTLNSYKLFIDSLGDTDTAIKPALMMEVAKAIYESGQTGYLGSNDKSDSSPSMIEMTKYISK